MEYADNGTLRDYLKKRFNDLTWNDKHNLAYQLTGAVLCLHEERIVHRDLVIYIFIYAISLKLLVFNYYIFYIIAFQ